MKDLIISVLGAYEPISYTDVSGNDIILKGVQGIDFPWIGGLVVFTLFIYGTIILIRSVFK